MRLSKIKLAGFKSFVDPTVIPFVSNLSAVVGPNGCGKSNVIDAIRWVMGESSAKNLRGGQLTDVIFNGSTSRKPLGQASVELHFDNSDNSLMGEYASYSEVVIRREFNRKDEKSNYFLNGVRCRRRDVMDLFRGTGLGPGSYAIMAQGTISKFVEAKPDELRIYIEEAAGISKYKERRRETENRMSHTRDNLTRLTDIRETLEKQVEHLRKQSIAAQKFKSLREEEHILSGQLAALSWQRYNNEVQHKQSAIQKLTTELEAQAAAHQQVETLLEKYRIEQQELQSQLNDAQAHYYAIGNEISNLEQKLQHQKEREIQLNVDKQETQKSLEEARAHQSADASRISTLDKDIAQAEPTYEMAREQAQVLSENQKEKETSLEGLREQENVLIKALEQIHRQSEVEKLKITQFEGQIQQALVRFTRLEEERKKLEAQENMVNLESIEQSISEKESTLQTLTQQLESHKAQRQTLQSQRNTLKPEINQLQKSAQQLEGRKASLEALQQAALGKDLKPIAQWLDTQALSNHKRLAECIRVSEPWSQALEMVLGNYLEALYLKPQEMNLVSEQVDTLSKGSITLLTTVAKPLETPHRFNHPRLLDYVQWEGVTPVLEDLLETVYVADSLAQALSLQEEFGAKTLQYSIITVGGIWLGPGWVRINKGLADDQSGVLKREEQLREIEAQLLSYKLEMEAKQAQHQQLEEAIVECEFAIDGFQSQRNQTHRLVSEETAQLKTHKASLMHKNQRLIQIQTDQEDIQKNNEEAQKQIIVARNIIAQTIETLAEKTQAKAEVEAARRVLSQVIVEDRAMHQKKINEAHSLALDLQKLRTERTAIAANQTRLENLLENLTEKSQNLTQALEQNSAPVEAFQTQLSQWLDKRIEAQEALNKVRDTASGLDNEIQSLEKKRLLADNASQNLRSALQSAQMECQALQIHRDNANTQLVSKECKLEDMLQSLPPEASEAQWQTDLNKIVNKLQNLGAINLASIEEYETNLERKRYLDEQNNDLNESLNLLQQSIDKIDKETRTRFKETFDTVNENFKMLFPKLFGGGEANLTLVGDDLLESGVGVIARPPGKKNTTIHLLSGGEKALTAVSLVFSIFQLNPAPFCLLDEVDAPLDDNNVSRFCALVKEMSQAVQFIYISHNKLALEMAGELQGVTMREPGVSRIVTVDIEKATEMVV